MNHLTNEQLENIIQGRDEDHTHLDQCQDCRERLAEKRAIAARLRSAFMSVKADEGLADRIRSQINRDSETTKNIASIRQIWAIRLHRKIWPALTAAAAILVVLLPLILYVTTPSTATAAQAELVMIHQQNLGSHREFYSDTDPEKLAEFFKDKLGFTPAFPCTGQGMEIRGCCVAHFKGQIVGSYVVDTPRGIISVIVVTETPKEMGMKHMPGKKGFEKSSYAQNNMVTVRLGDYSYCAIGKISEISHEYLRGLLNRLLPNTQQ
ncbi:MAG: hypothetical protein FVQ79_09530 [Planctomycetes bacterium]|nr:hypothetical protein [Planctomycetota bacterium]